MICTLGFKYLISFNNSHKHRDRPIIYYELVAIYSPSIIAGTLIGVYFLQVASQGGIFIVIIVSMIITIC